MAELSRPFSDCDKLAVMMSDDFQNERSQHYSRLVKCETGFSLDHIAEAMFNIIIDEISLGVCFEIHRDAKTGALEAEGLDDRVPLEFRVVNQPGRDVLGQPLAMKRPPDAQCPVCQRSIACTRFAPHLEKCVGLGRNSSRLASRRIASNQLAASVGSDDEIDEDWAARGTVGTTGGGGTASDRRKKRRDKLSPRRTKTSRRCMSVVSSVSSLDKDSDTKSNLSNASSSAPSTPEQALQYEQLSEQERCHLLNQVCGVIVEGTRHMCTRSVRCQQHSDGQRRSVRVALFGAAAAHNQQFSPSPLEGAALSDSLHRLWDRASRASSPSDSGSNGASGVTGGAGKTGRRAAAAGRSKKRVRVKASAVCAEPTAAAGIQQSV